MKKIIVILALCAAQSLMHAHGGGWGGVGAGLGLGIIAGSAMANRPQTVVVQQPEPVYVERAPRRSEVKCYDNGRRIQCPDDEEDDRY